MFRKSIQIAALSLFLTSSAAFAHEEAKGPNGGQVADASGHHVEFVPAAGEVTFFLSDEEGKPIASLGAKGKVIVQQDGKANPVELAPAEPNKLSAKLAAPLASGAKLALTATLPDGHSVQALFTNP